MKKIINLLSILAIVAGLVLGISGAYFTDVEASPTNIFSAGILELSTDGEYTTMPIEATNIKPGDSGLAKIRLKNTGSLSGLIEAATIVVLDDLENGCNAPEELVDSTCGNPGQDRGELDKYLEIRLWIDADEDDLLSVADEIYFIESEVLVDSDGIINQPSDQISLDPDQVTDVKLFWQADPSHTGGNVFQGDATSFSISFDFKQV